MSTAPAPATSWITSHTASIPKRSNAKQLSHCSPSTSNTSLANIRWASAIRLLSKQYETWLTSSAPRAFESPQWVENGHGRNELKAGSADSVNWELPPCSIEMQRGHRNSFKGLLFAIAKLPVG